MTRLPFVAAAGLLSMMIAGADAGPATVDQSAAASASRVTVAQAGPVATEQAGGLVWALAGLAGDAARGEQIAAAGTEAGAAPCVACHGEQGEGIPGTGSPRIAGQAGFYLAKQLQDYASGARPNDIMTPIAQVLAPEEMRDVSAYYAQMSAASPPPGGGGADPDLLAWGETLVTVGSNDKGVQACSNCHGPNASGLPPAGPYLAGQHADYQRAQMHQWKAAERRNDAAGVMRGVAARLDDRDIDALATYLARLQSQPAR